MGRWIHVRFESLARLLEDERLPSRLRWHWYLAQLHGRKRLQVVSPRGVHWPPRSAKKGRRGAAH